MYEIAVFNPGVYARKHASKVSARIAANTTQLLFHKQLEYFRFLNYGINNAIFHVICLLKQLVVQWDPPHFRN